MIAQPQGRYAVNPTTGERVLVAGPAASQPPAPVSAPGFIETRPADPVQVRERDLSVQGREVGIADTGADNARADRQLGNSEANEGFDRLAKLRDQFSSDPEIRGFSGVRNSFEALQRIGREGNAQSDMALIFSFMRSLDPGSVVREAEQDMAQGATGLGGQFENFISRLMNGEKLNDQQRSQMIAIAQQLYRARAMGYNSRAERFRTLLGQQGVTADQLDTHIPLVPFLSGGEMGGIVDDTLTNRPMPPNPTGPAPAPTPLAGERPQPPAPGGDRVPDVAVTGMGGPQVERRLYEDGTEATGRNDPTRAGLNGRVRQLFLQNAPPETYRSVLSEAGMSSAQIEDVLRHVTTADQWARRNRGRREDVGFDLEREMRNVEGIDVSEARNPEATGWENAGQRADSVVRGAADTATMGLADEAVGLFGGEEAMMRQRAIDQWDEDHQTGTRVAGQVLGGMALPFPGKNMAATNALARYAPQMRAGGAYGAAYGFGSGDGNLAQRGGNALLMGGLGAVAAPVVDTLLSPVARLVGGTRARANSTGIPNRAEAVAAADRLGITNELMPATTGGTGTQMATGAIGQTPGRIPINSGVQREASAIAGAVDDTARSMGRVRDARGAGQAAQEGVEAGVARREAQQTTLFNRVPIRPDVDAVTTNSQRALADLTAGFQSNPKLSEMFRNSRLEGYREALQSGRLSWQDLNALRARVGEIIGSPTALKDDTTTGQLRALYGAIREDMRATARQAGPNVERNLDRAFQFAERLHRDREQVFSRILGRRMNATGEDAYGAIMSMARRDNGDVHGLRRLFSALPKEEANSIRATALSRMGLARQQNAEGDAFSTRTFITNWSKMDPAAQRVLMGREGAQAIQDLVTIAGRANHGQRFTNWSNSGMAVGTSGALLVGTVDLASAAIASLASLGSGALLSNKAVTAALAAGARRGNASALADRLSRIAARNPGISQEVTGLRDMILRAANDNLAPAARRAAASEPGQGEDENNPR